MVIPYRQLSVCTEYTKETGTVNQRCPGQVRGEYCPYGVGIFQFRTDSTSFLQAGLTVKSSGARITGPGSFGNNLVI